MAAKKYPRVQVLVGTAGGWFKPGQYGIVVGENRRGGMHLQDGGRESRPGEIAYAVGKSERSGAVWFSGAALRFTASKKASASAKGSRQSRGLPAKLQVTPMSREDASALLARSERSVAARRASRHENGENPRVSAPLKKRIDRVLGRGRRV